MAVILATAARRRFAQGTTDTGFARNDFVPASDQLLRRSCCPAAEKRW